MSTIWTMQERLIRTNTSKMAIAFWAIFLGSKDASRQVAANASKKSGISSSILKKLLPIAAGLFMASLSKNSRSKNMFGQEKVTSDNAGMLSKGLNMFLDSDNDGSVVDDLLGMAAKMFF